MACIAPTVGKVVQVSVELLPVGLGPAGMLLRPSLQLGHERFALRFVLGRLGLDFFKPCFHHLVGLVAGFVKALPQIVVGHAALVYGFPLLAQMAQGLLHLAPA